MRYARDEPALGRGRAGRSSRSPWGPADGPGRMALRQGSRRARQSHAGAPAARAPELNPVENIWQFLRANWLSSRVFASYRNIVDHCCDAWNRLIDQPWLIM